ncbi:hypothetical protein CNEO3_70120 [Clostridium neonatale]|nr:hypothetical protein CNEO3_70120 [Clostridium neonatale]
MVFVCLRGFISFFLLDIISNSTVQRTMMPTPMTASKRLGAAVVPAYSLMSNPTKISAAENGYMLERMPPLKNIMLYPRKNARIEPPRYAP